MKFIECVLFICKVAWCGAREVCFSVYGVQIYLGLGKKCLLADRFTLGIKNADTD